MKCIYCEKEFEKLKSLSSHKVFCKKNPNKKESHFVKWNSMTDRVKKNQWSNGDYQLKDETRKKMSEKSSQRVTTQETKNKLSLIAKNKNFGGVNQSKKIKYKDKILGSTYELKVAIDLDKNNINWNTCSKFEYIDPFGKKRTYTPDIYLIDYNIYLDPKNDFLLNNINPALGFTDTEKINLVMKQNNIKVLILNKTELLWNKIKKRI